MRYAASEKLEIIRLVEESHLSARQTLAKLGIPRTTFYRWYDRYLQRGEDSIAELCRREGISQGIYYKWSKDFMEAGKKRLAGDTARAANTDEVKELRREAKDLKEVVAEQTLELRLLKKSMFDGGGDPE